MSIYIFGGDGFVGRHLSEKLVKAGHQVIICDLVREHIPQGAEYKKVDIRNKEEFGQLPIKAGDAVINLAANQYHNKVPRKGREAFFFDTNTKGAENILEYAYEKGCRSAIQYTTDMTYGKPQYLPVDTKHPQVPFGPYGRSKKAAEAVCAKYREQGMNISIFRPRMIIGPGRLGILKKLFWLIDHHLPVPTIGNGKNCYQMISVFDCVDATIRAMELDFPNQEYNLGSTSPPSTRELLQGLIQSVGSRSIVLPTWAPLVKLALKILGGIGLEIMYKEQYMIADENYIIDMSETESKLGWKPKFMDTDMIRQAYQEYKRLG